MEPDPRFFEDCFRLIPLGECDGLLWHYTTAAAAVEIIKSSCLHLLCENFMNDPEDGQRALKVVAQCWSKVLDGIGSAGTKLDLDRLHLGKRFFYSSPPDFSDGYAPTFLFSTSAHRDALSQWTRYGGDGAGIALGFNFQRTAFKPFSKESFRVPFLWKVHYDFDDDSDRTSPAPADLLSESAKFRANLTALFISHLQTAPDVAVAENAPYVAAELLKPMIKQGAYHDEHEWRVAGRADVESTSLYSIRTNRFGVAPYMVLPFGPGVELKEVMLGPRLPAANLWSVEWLCRKQGLREVKVSKSMLAYR